MRVHTCLGERGSGSRCFPAVPSLISLAVNDTRIICPALFSAPSPTSLKPVFHHTEGLSLEYHANYPLSQYYFNITHYSSFHFLFHSPNITPTLNPKPYIVVFIFLSIIPKYHPVITPIYTPLYYSSFHFLFHYPNIPLLYTLQTAPRCELASFSLLQEGTLASAWEINWKLLYYERVMLELMVDVSNLQTLQTLSPTPFAPDS